MAKCICQETRERECSWITRVVSPLRGGARGKSKSKKEAKNHILKQGSFYNARLHPERSTSWNTHFFSGCPHFSLPSSLSGAARNNLCWKATCFCLGEQDALPRFPEQKYMSWTSDYSWTELGQRIPPCSSFGGCWKIWGKRTVVKNNNCIHLNEKNGTCHCYPSNIPAVFFLFYNSFYRPSTLDFCKSITVGSSVLKLF